MNFSRAGAPKAPLARVYINVLKVRSCLVFLELMKNFIHFYFDVRKNKGFIKLLGT